MERTLVEAIVEYREKAKFFKATTNVAYGLKLDQIADWLEELSRRRVEELFRKTNEKAIRDKAIDDFVNACKDDILCQTFGLRQCDIEKIAEQLKECDNSAKQFEG